MPRLNAFKTKKMKTRYAKKVLLKAALLFDKLDISKWAARYVRAQIQISLALNGQVLAGGTKG